MSIEPWVIGGTSGIGEEIAKQIIEERGGDVWATGEDHYDMSNGFMLRLAVDEFERRNQYSKKYEIVYSAGINELAHLGKTSPDDFTGIMDVNFIGFAWLVNELRKRDFRNVKLVAISSDAAVRPMRTSMAYCASKAALNMGVRVAARELAEFGWRVNAVAPGMTEGTGMTEYIDDTVPGLRGWTKKQTEQYELDQAVIKRRATREEVAKMVLSILSGPDYLNGEIITINGGR